MRAKTTCAKAKNHANFDYFWTQCYIEIIGDSPSNSKTCVNSNSIAIIFLKTE